jgi:thymidylate synthase
MTMPKKKIKVSHKMRRLVERAIKLHVDKATTSFYASTTTTREEAEVAWFLLGERSIAFIQTYAQLWNKFVDELGPNDFGVKAAYGYRWRRHFGRDQLRLAIETLHRDPTDRRCYVSAWDPSEDGLGAGGQKNVPCPVGFSLSTQDRELHSALTLRSSDVFVGLPYDVMGHALLMDAVASELGIAPGVMHVTLAHAHLYDVHWDMARESLRQVPVLPRLELPRWDVTRIEQEPHEYVEQFAEAARALDWPKYNPRPEVVV